MLGIGIGVPFSVQSLIAQIQAIFVEKTGFWGRPILLSSLFQDSAGTTPVTAVEQPVGRVLDQSGSGNHATQATAAARPVLSSRVNSVMKSEDLSDASWAKTAAGTGVVPIVTSGFLAPDGTMTAWRVQLDKGAGTTTTDQSQVSANSDGSQTAGTLGVWLRLNSGTSSFVRLGGLTNVTVTDTWQFLESISTVTNLRITLRGAQGTSDAADLLVWHPQHGVSGTRYQRVNTATDYDTAGFPSFLKLDGVDDSLSSPTGGGGTAGFFFSQAIKPLSGAGTIRTLWSDAQANAGYRVRINASNQLELSSGSGTPLAPPVQNAAVNSATGGTGLAASTAYFYVITALNGKGESLKSNEVTVTTTAGTTDSNAISWAASSGAASYRIYRGTATGAENVFYAVGNVLTFTDTGAASTAGSPPTVSETAYTPVATAEATVIGTTALVTAWDDSININVQLGSGVVASVARSVVAAGTAGFTLSKQNGAAAGFFSGNLYSPVYVRNSGLTAAQRATIQALVRQEAGL